MKTVLLTIPEVARRLSVSRWTIYRYINKGIIKPIRLPDGKVRMPEAELQRFLKHLSSFVRKPPDDIDIEQAKINYFIKTGLWVKH